jgi:hypothetical protein
MSDRHIVVGFGRMNPPTVGHQKMVDRMHSIAKKVGGHAELHLSHSMDSKKNPLGYEKKHELAHQAFGDIVKKSNNKSVFDTLKDANTRGDHLHMVGGQDRAEEYKKIINKYNGSEHFNFKSVTFHNAGRRHEGSGVEGMSASKMRAAAASRDHQTFHSGLPEKIRHRSHEIMSHLRSGMGLEEETLYETIDNNAEQLLRLGLGDPKFITQYKRVLMMPQVAIRENQYRRHLLEMFKKMRKIIFENNEIYNKVRLSYIKEGLEPAKIDFILKNKLFIPMKELAMYRSIVIKPEVAINDSYKRPMLIRAFGKFRDMILTDNYVFERAKRELYLGKRKSFNEWSELINMNKEVI